MEADKESKRRNKNGKNTWISLLQPVAVEGFGSGKTRSEDNLKERHIQTAN